MYLIQFWLLFIDKTSSLQTPASYCLRKNEGSG